MRNVSLLLVLNGLALGVAQAAGPVVSVSTYTLLMSSQADNACQDGSPHCSSKPSWEQEMEKAQSSWGACQDEVNKFCEGVQVGEGRIENCLKAHRKKLSAKCKASLQINSK